MLEIVHFSSFATFVTLRELAGEGLLAPWLAGARVVVPDVVSAAGTRDPGLRGGDCA